MCFCSKIFSCSSTELLHPLRIQLFWNQTYPSAACQAWLVQLPAIRLFPSALTLNRKSMPCSFTHFCTLVFVSLVLSSFPLSVNLFFLWSLAHSDLLSSSWALFSAVFLFTPLLVTLSFSHCVWLPFPLNWMTLTSASLCISLLSWSPWVLWLVAMVIQRVKWCWVISGGSWQEDNGDREICWSIGCNKAPIFLLYWHEHWSGCLVL